ncbi:MAG: TolC family protein, partial [Phocaeicola sp.]|nr:TolC family protein [Phocaeicola sp.]
MNIKCLLSCVFLFGAAVVASAQGKRILTLEECKDMALKYNAEIQTGKIDIEAARQTQKEAFAKYFPKISAGAATYKADDNLVKVNIPDLTQLGLPITAMEVGMLEEGNLVTVSAMQPVFAGGQIVNSNKLARTAMEASVLQLDMTADKVKLETENYYWKIVSLKEAEKTINILDTLLQTLHKDVSLAIKAGLTTQNDLLTVQLKQNELQSTRLQVENGIMLSCMALSQYIGLPLDSAEYIDVPEFKSEINSPGYYLVDHHTALSSLSTSKLLEKNVEAYKLKRKISLGQQLPTVGVGVSYAYEDLMFDKSRNHFIMMATVSVPVSDWWSGSHKVKRAKLEEQKAVRQQQDGNEKLQLKMQQSWNLLTESYKQIILAESAVKESEENLRMQTNNYRTGICSL